MQKKYSKHSCDICGKEILYRDSDPYPFTGVSLPIYSSSTNSISIVKKYLCNDCLMQLAQDLEKKYIRRD